MKELHNIPERL